VTGGFSRRAQLHEVSQFKFQYISLNVLKSKTKAYEVGNPTNMSAPRVSEAGVRGLWHVY
jgi:hypothetical protein